MCKEIQEKTIKLKTATAADLTALATMAGKLFREAFTGQMPEEDLLEYVSHAFKPEIFLEEWKKETITFIIAMYGEEWAGYAKLNTSNRIERADVHHYIELERLYLFKEFHGLKLGAALMDYCLQFATAKNFRELWLNVWERNTKAIAFYLSYDFEMVDRSIMMRGNDAQVALWMKKQLPG